MIILDVGVSTWATVGDAGGTLGFGLMIIFTLTVYALALKGV